jgi:hypothetical protein
MGRSPPNAFAESLANPKWDKKAFDGFIRFNVTVSVLCRP